MNPLSNYNNYYEAGFAAGLIKKEENNDPAQEPDKIVFPVRFIENFPLSKYFISSCNGTTIAKVSFKKCLRSQIHPPAHYTVRLLSSKDRSIKNLALQLFLGVIHQSYNKGFEGRVTLETD